MNAAHSGPLSVYQGKAFIRFAKKARMIDADLWRAAQRANEGLVTPISVEG